MVYSLRSSRVLPGLHTIYPPRSFLRHKSITAAIERGRQGGPDRPSRPRTRSFSDDNERPPYRKSHDSRPFRPRDEGRTSSFRDRVGSRPEGRRDERKPGGFSRGGADSRFENQDRGGFGRSREGNSEARPERRRDERASRFGRDRPESKFERQRDEGTSRFGRDRMETKFERRRDNDRGGFRRNDRSEMRSEAPPWRRDERPGAPSGGRPRQYEGRPTQEGHSDTRYGQERPERQSGDRQGFTDRSRYASEFKLKYDEPDIGLPDPAIYSRQQTQSSRHSAGETQARKSLVRDVESLPYTTAASEFVYGYSSVVAALKANRRKLYNIYVHSRGASRDGLLSKIRAQKMFSITQEVGDEYLRAMDKASAGRPHNGVILETSSLPVPPITDLKSSSIEDSSFRVALDSQSAEDAIVNGNQEIYSYKSAGWRHPLILYVDGVLDEGNLGAIARSAYFLGVDAVITPTRQSAPWSHIAVKASAGAAEALCIFKVGEPADFLGKCSRAGWRIYASDAVPAAPSISDSTSVPVDEDHSKIVYTIPKSSKRLPVDHSPVAEHPTILMMGAESDGLRKSLLNLAHYKVGVVHGRDVDEIGVDSLNVSVAASLLCFDMLQKRVKKTAPAPEEVLF